VRALYPALADGHAYLDGAAGTQVPVSVIEAIAAAYREGFGNLGGAFPASGRADAIVAHARAAVADLVGATPGGVVFGPSATALAYRIADALSRGWTAGDDIVVSRLDHDSNVRPWIQAFSLGKPPYGPAEIEEQKRGIYDAGYDGWVLWHPGSKFVAKSA